MTGARIFDIVISKLSYEQESSPVILFKVDKDLEIYFYCIILTLRLAVRL